MRHRAGARIVLLLVAVVLTPALLFAHAMLKRSSPAAKAVLAASPTVIGLWFTETPELRATRVLLVDSAGRETPLTKVSRDSVDRSGVLAEVPLPLADGAYTVKWRTAAADGHASSGSFSFSVRTQASAAGAPAVTATPAIPRPDTARAAAERSTSDAGTPIMRVFEFLALLSVIGAVVFQRVVGPNAQLDGASGPARRFTQVMLAVLVVTLLARLFGEAATLGMSADGMSVSAARSTVFGTSWGHGWLVGAGGALLAAAGLALARQTEAGWKLVWIGVAALVVYPAMTGHAAASADHRFLAVAADTVHVAAVGTWLGTLFVIGAVGVPVAMRYGSGPSGTRVAFLVRAFHPVALVAVVAVVLSGATSAWLRLGALAPLWQSSYGRIVLFKICALLILTALGALNSRVLITRLSRPSGVPSLRRSVAAELVLGGLVIIATALLVSTQPPTSLPTTPSASSASGSP